MSIFFIAAELVGGWLANSIAIFADSAHLASDMIGFGISIVALRLAQKSSDDGLTYGWHRAEIVGTLISVATIWVMTVWLVVEATNRLFEPPKVLGGRMLLVAIASLIFNLIQMKILHSGDGHYHLGGDCHDHDHDHDHDHGHGQAHDHNADHFHPAAVDSETGNDHEHHHHHHHDKPKSNINVDAAFLHVLGDMIMSVGVIIAATIIYFFPHLWYFDPICTYFFSVIVVVTTVPVIKMCLNVVMEGVPTNFNVAAFKRDMWALNTEGHMDIIDIHDLHVWSISVGKLAMTVHIKSHRPLKTLSEVTNLCREKYGLYHTVI